MSKSLAPDCIMEGFLENRDVGTVPDGAHAQDDPIIYGGKSTTLREMHAAKRLTPLVVRADQIPPYIRIPPYTREGRPAYMCVVKGTSQGWEVSKETLLLMFKGRE